MGNPQFNTRSDNAALRIKEELNARNGTQLGSTPVAVGSDGKPPAPPPPEGSYARQAHDQQLAEAQAAMQAGQPTPQQVVGVQPPAGTPTQQSDGSQAPPLAGGEQQVAAPTEPQPHQISENANTRIQGLIEQMREKDHQIAQLAGSQAELAEAKAQNAALQAEREAFLQSHLDELDPEQRAAILSESRTREMLEQNNAMILGAIDQRLQPLQQDSYRNEMERVAARYPGFDMQTHPVLIDTLRAKYPGMSYEHAFKAVAEGDEAIPRSVAAQAAVPPVVPAGNGAPLPRYIPEPQSDPNDELVAFQQRTNKLIRSSDPVEQRQGLRQMDQAIAERLRGSTYQGKPPVFD